MENQNYTIGVNLICILLIITLSVALFMLTVVYLLSFSGFYKDYLLNNYSTNYYNFYIVTTPIWILFYFLFLFFSILAFKKRNMGRISVVSLAMFGVCLTYFQHLINIVLCDEYSKVYLVRQSITVHKDLLLWIAAIYLFTRPKIKEMFLKQKGG